MVREVSVVGRGCSIGEKLSKNSLGSRDLQLTMSKWCKCGNEGGGAHSRLKKTACANVLWQKEAWIVENRLT